MTAIKSILCQLWNLQTVTVDIAKANLPSKSDDHLSFLVELKEQIFAKINRKVNTIPDFDIFRLVQDGKELTLGTEFKVEKPVHVELRGSLKGGKGGFGSLLRSVKPKAQQDDNFEACRDLSGRRLRHINNERRIRQFQ